MSGRWLGSHKTTNKARTLRALAFCCALLTAGQGVAVERDTAGHKAASEHGAGEHATDQTVGGNLPKLYFGVGAIAYQLARTSGSDTGAPGLASAFQPEIHLTYRQPLGGTWFAVPSVAFTLIGRGTQDGAATVRLMPISLDVGVRLGHLELKFGPGILVTTVSGSGGTVQLDNGAGTSTFARPSGTSSSATLYLGVGAGTRVMDRVRVDGTLLMQSLLSDRRALSFMGQVSYEIF